MHPLTRVEVPVPPISRPRPIILIAVYFFYVTVVLRTLAEWEVISSRLPIYLTLEFLFGVLFTLMLWRPFRRGIWPHLYFVFQSLLALFLLALNPDLDFTNVLLVLLSFQAVLVFQSRVHWAWVVIQVLLIVLSLTLFMREYGLALSLLPATAALILPAYVVITREIEAGQRSRHALLAELQEANRQLTAYTSQVEELARIQERNRLARELHNSVSQTMFSIGLHSRATRILLDDDPEKLRLQLEQLQTLTQNALEEMRSLIADLRPQPNETTERPTP